MEKIRIRKTDLLFDEHGDGKGTLKISDNKHGHSFSSYFNAMREQTTLKQFIQQIDTCYFVKNFSNNKTGDFNKRKTFANLRRYIKDSFGNELPWYKHTEFQKHFREELMSLQNRVLCVNNLSTSFIGFSGTLNFSLIKDKDERQSICNTIENIFHSFDILSCVAYDMHPEDVFLVKLHKDIKLILKKPIQLCLF